MTATTPEQLRQRAADHETAAEHGALLKDAEAHRETAAMLRAAADQLEAAERWVERARWNSSDIADEADAYVTAYTAPQEDRDD